MPYDGAGNFSRIHNWTQDKIDGIKITSVRHDAEDDGFAGAFNDVLLRNGVAALTGNLKLGGNSITGIAAGAVATPSITPNADVTTGACFPAAGVMAFSSAGVERLRINGTGAAVTGNLGVNTNTPRTALDVVGISSFRGAFEDCVISATGISGTVNIDYTTAAVVIYTLNATGNFVFNIRGDALNAINSLMAANQMLTVAIEVPQGATAYYCTAITVDGLVPLDVNWQNGAPTQGNANGVDVYLIRVFKTGSNLFAVRASVSQEL